MGHRGPGMQVPAEFHTKLTLRYIRKKRSAIVPSSSKYILHENIK